MAKSAKTSHVCGQCGHESAKWLGQCPQCGQWHTMQEVRSVSPVPSSGGSVVPLAQVEQAASRRVLTGWGEVDRILGGGLMPGSFILLGGDPGVGKSTLTLQLGQAGRGLRLLYVAGEESPHQIRQRADRIGVSGDSIRIYNGTEVEGIVRAAREEKPDLLVVDSIQTVFRGELGGLPGSIQQIRESAAVLQQLAKRDGITTLLIGHVNKDGEIAGPRMLEHMVDTVLQFEGDPLRLFRLLRSVKNRFGPAQEVAVFEMTGSGLRQVDNPSELFLSDPGRRTPGRCVTCVMEGTRPILVEVQALVARSGYATPQRMASGFDQRRLSLLLAVLERRCGVNLAGQDVYVGVAGGFRVSDPAADAAVAVAVVSSLWDVAPVDGAVVAAEMGLSGDLRTVASEAQRIQECAKLGFTSYHGGIPRRQESADVGRVAAKRVATVSDLLRAMLGSESAQEPGSSD